MLAAIFAPPPLSRVANNMGGNVCTSYKFIQEDKGRKGDGGMYWIKSVF